MPATRSGPGPAGLAGRGLTPPLTPRINGLVGQAARGYCPGVSSWGHVEVAHVSHVLPDGRVLFDDVSFRIGEGNTAALVGPNGAGKTTLLRLVAGDLQPQEGTVVSTGGLGVMRQFIGTDERARASRPWSVTFCSPSHRRGCGKPRPGWTRPSWP